MPRMHSHESWPTSIYFCNVGPRVVGIPLQCLPKVLLLRPLEKEEGERCGGAKEVLTREQSLRKVQRKEAGYSNVHP